MRLQKVRNSFIFNKQLLVECIKGAVLIITGGWLCFRNVVVCLAGLALLPFYLRGRSATEKHKRQLAQQKEFKDAMAMLYSSTAAGSTLEKAFSDALHDMKSSENRYPYLLPEFERICVCLNRNVPMTDALNNFARRSGDADIYRFVQIITIARKSGGSLPEIIRQSMDAISLRMEINSEIDTLLAGRRGELKVMMIVPAGIIGYMNLCSADYMSVLYLTWTGRCIMLAALAVYVAAVCIGKKILDIRI
jgi:tight adherence protein B